MAQRDLFFSFSLCQRGADDPVQGASVDLVRSDVAQQLAHLVLELLRWYTSVCSLKPNIALDPKLIRIENSALNSIPPACRNCRYASELTHTHTDNKTMLDFSTYLFPAYLGLIFTSSF